MSMPSIPDINPNISICRDDAVNIIITSIAMEELALAHILNAEGEKLQYFLGTLDNVDPGEVTICDIMAVNESIQKTLKDVIKEELLLQLKLEEVAEISEKFDKCQTTIRGRKIWRDSDNAAATRPPSVEINLMRDGDLYKTVTVDSTGDGYYTFSCLPVWKNSEEKYVYQVDEIDVPTGYAKTIEGYNVINTALPGQITIDCLKTWSDSDDETGERPDQITVRLMQNGNEIRSTNVDTSQVGENTFTFDFIDVPQFDDDGNLFVYTLIEDDITGYEQTIVGYNITNTLTNP